MDTEIYSTLNGDNNNNNHLKQSGKKFQSGINLRSNGASGEHGIGIQSTAPPSRILSDPGSIKSKPGIFSADDSELNTESIRQASTDYQGASNVLEAADDVGEWTEVLTRFSRLTADDRTIVEAEFNHRRECLVSAAKRYVSSCKESVNCAPQAGHHFTQSICASSRVFATLVARCCMVLDCISLPSDRSEVADKVAEVARSFQIMVSVATLAVGKPLEHSNVQLLKQNSTRLVGELFQLMNVIKKLNYNRVSRRF